MVSGEDIPPATTPLAGESQSALPQDETFAKYHENARARADSVS